MDSDPQQLVEEIIRIVSAERKAPYSGGDGYLAYGAKSAGEIVVYPQAWEPTALASAGGSAPGVGEGALRER